VSKWCYKTRNPPKVFASGGFFIDREIDMKEEFYIEMQKDIEKTVKLSADIKRDFLRPNMNGQKNLLLI
jgi:hypothetical protein